MKISKCIQVGFKRIKAQSNLMKHFPKGINFINPNSSNHVKNKLQTKLQTKEL